MKTTVAVLIGTFAALTLLVPFAMRRQGLIQSYARLDDRKLVESNSSARMMKRRCRITAWTAPLVIILASRLVSVKQDVLVILAIIAMLTCFLGVVIFSNIEEVTTAEMDLRTFRAKQAHGGAHELGSGGVESR